MASEIKANKISPATGTAFTLGDSGDAFTIPSGATLSAPGHIAQVIQVVKTDTFSHATASWVDITDLTVDITPSATSSRIYVTCAITLGQRGSTSYFWVKLVRDSTDIFVGDAAGSRRQVSVAGNTGTAAETASGNISYIDSPNTTSATTYKLQMSNQNTDTQYINRSYSDSDNDGHSRGASTIIVMEVLG
jgi:hypothetical protein